MRLRSIAKPLNEGAIICMTIGYKAQGYKQLPVWDAMLKVL